MAKVNGYILREAIRNWEARKNTVSGQFDSSLVRFKDEDKPCPEAIASEIMTCVEALATLREAQGYYNLNVSVSLPSRKMTLARAVKMVSDLGAFEKMWRSASGPKKDRYTRYEDETRKEGEEKAQRTISFKNALTMALDAMRMASHVRAAIAKGNMTEIEIEFLDKGLI